jgi:hypothetical protein
MVILKISKQMGKIHESKSALFHEGFLLIEVMVSLILFVFFIHLMYRYETLILETKYEALKRYEALNILHSFLAKATKKPSLLQEKNYADHGCTLTWTVEDFPFKKTDILNSLSSKTRCLRIYAQWQGWNKKNRTASITTGLIL